MRGEEPLDLGKTRWQWVVEHQDPSASALLPKQSRDSYWEADKRTSML